MQIEVKKLSDEELNNLGVFSWSIWTKEKSEFDWYYDDKESCYILEGDVEVISDFGVTHFGKGDFVVFPKGLSCKWKINKNVKKHYNFG
ncbi:MAG: cupin [Spirochaetes bacterium GWC1_27_15]|nr:MAG: cupin [Spirochaetes bacterium GWB1_27_13]OHD22335.1 MAG: cupin [Spirochaetes bacterium GWC1_27_15]